jgi:Reverse transcriptase (RNA-dependent DNA polymerase).
LILFPSYICFVDLEKAFDNLDLWDTFNILLENDVPNGIILLIKDIHSNNFSHIRIQSKLIEKDAITRGVSQEDSLSPLL